MFYLGLKIRYYSYKSSLLGSVLGFSVYTRGHISPDCLLRDDARVLEIIFSCGKEKDGQMFWEGVVLFFLPHSVIS